MSQILTVAPDPVDLDRFRRVRATVDIAVQKPYEIAALRTLLRNTSERGLMCEIGVEKGTSTKMLADLYQRYVGIDPKPQYKPAACPLLHGRDPHMTMIQADSQRFETVVAVYRECQKAGQLLDFLFIDGDHGYEAVSRDFDWYSKLVRPGGIVAFHDVADHPINEPFGNQVFWFWQHLKTKRLHDRCWELMNDTDARADWAGLMGIGVIQLSSDHKPYPLTYEWPSY